MKYFVASIRHPHENTYIRGLRIVFGSKHFSIDEKKGWIQLDVFIDTGNKISDLFCGIFN